MNAVDKKKKIINLLNKDEVKGRILALLSGDEKKLESFKAALLNIALDKQLAKASPESIIKSALQIAELNLPLSKNLGLAYIVAYKNEAQAQVGYKGWQVLLRRSGILTKTRLIYDVDEFSIEYDGFEDKFRLVPNLEKREETERKWIEKHLIGGWVSFKFVNSGEVMNIFVPAKKIWQLINLSPALRANKGYSPYETGFFLEMLLAKITGWASRRIGVDSEWMEKLFNVDNSTTELPQAKEEKVEDVLEAEVEIIEEKEEEEA